MRRDADALVAGIAVGETASLVLYDEGWHQGVIGLLAGRLKDAHHRTVIALAPAGEATRTRLRPLDSRAAPARCARSRVEARARTS